MRGWMQIARLISFRGDLGQRCFSAASTTDLHTDLPHVTLLDRGRKRKWNRNRKEEERKGKEIALSHTHASTLPGFLSFFLGSPAPWWFSGSFSLSIGISIGQSPSLSFALDLDLTFCLLYLDVETSRL